MLLLFETPAGYALFKVHDEGKLEGVDVRAPPACRPLPRRLNPGRSALRPPPADASRAAQCAAKLEKAFSTVEGSKKASAAPR
jgi:hypothetical protein